MRTLSRLFNLVLIVSMLLSAFALSASAAPRADAPALKPSVEVEAELLAQLESKGSAGYLIYFKDRPDLSAAYSMGWRERGWYVYETLKAAAERAQPAVQAYLDGQKVAYQAFWIDNVIAVESSTQKVLDGLTAFGEIEVIRALREPVLYEPVEVKEAPDSPEAIEPNITHVGADQVWAMGYNGTGIVVANIDTGVRYTHDALVNQYRGNLGGSYDHNYNWWDPYNHTAAPVDWHDHGSHTMGTMVGDDGGSNQIGMAPGARWMACLGFPSGGANDPGLLECAQFMAAPWDLTGANPNPDLRPHIVNNSWGDCGRSMDPWYKGVIASWHAAGVYPSFSNGNASNCGYPSPPGLNTVGNPARYGEVMGVGSTGRSDGAYASYSNWGPTDNPDTVNPLGDPLLKPQVLAPGLNRSAFGSVGDNAYGDMSGTSMASPHAVGLVALMWSAAPCLVGDYATTENILEQTANPIPYDDGTGGGPHVPNYASGWGEIVAPAAVTAAIVQCGDSILTGRVTDASVPGDPIAGALVEAEGLTQSRHGRTDAQGYYTFTVFADVFTVTASAYAYLPEQATSVTVVTGTTTVQDFSLTPAPMATVDGVVSDATTGWPLYAEIAIDGYPGGSLWTDPVTGGYSVMLPEGMAFTFHVNAWSGGYLGEDRAVGPLSGAQTEDFDLVADTDVCSAPGYQRQITGIFADFDEGVWPPPGWTVVNNGGACEWTNGDPGGRGNLTGGDGLFAIADSDNCGIGTTMDTELVSPVFDGTALPSVELQFKYDYNWFSSDYAYVDYSTDGGSSWNNVVTWNSDQPGPATFVQDLTAELGSTTQARIRFHYTAFWDYWWEVDDVLVGEAACVPMAGGLAVGNVSDAITTDPLVGAEVANDSGLSTATVAVPDDPALEDGFYLLFSPAGSHTFTATMAGGYAPETALVTVPLSGTVRQDFALGSPELVVPTASMEETLEFGASSTQTLVISNTGTAPLTFELMEQDRGMGGGAMTVSIPPSDGQFPRGDEPASLSRPPQPTAESDRATAPEIKWVDGVMAYATELFGANLVNFDTDTPGSLNVIGNIGGGDYYAGDFLGGDFSKLYVLDAAGNQLLAVNTATGVPTAIGAAAPAAGESWTGMAGAPDGTLYATGSTCGSSTLYTIDPATAAVTPVGPIANGPCVVGIAVNAEGAMYGLDLVGDSLVSVDPLTGAGTVVGSIGFNANYAQGMDFDEESGVLYLAAYNGTTSSAELRIADTTTGNSVVVAPFPASTEVDALGIATGGGGDVPWLSEDPITGTIPAGSEMAVDVTLDSSQVIEPGVYLANLHVKADDPRNPKATVPVTLTVVPSANMGKLEGTITSDRPGGPLAADVEIQNSVGMTWTVSSDPTTGYYYRWLSAGTYTVTAMAAGYLPGVAEVTITGLVTTVLDLELMLNAPEIEVAPLSLAADLMLGDSSIQTVTITNLGVAPLDYEILEIPGPELPPLEATGGPDPFGYTFIDSLEPSGPTYDFVDISASGTAVMLGDDAFGGPFPIGFTFNFYGTDRTEFYVSSNGHIDFGAGSSSLSNQCPLPSTTTPNELIALLWDDLDPGDTSDAIYYQSFASCPYGGSACLVVQYQGFHHYPGGGAAAGTWEAILYENGSILIQFEDVGAEAGSGSTTGIEGPGGTAGLTYACNAASSLVNASAVCFIYPGSAGCGAGDVPWLSTDPISGTVPAYSSAAVAVTLDSSAVAGAGSYAAELKINHNDPDSPAASVDVMMNVFTSTTTGMLEGYVAGMGHCDANPTPMEGASVLIEMHDGMTMTRTTNENGQFQAFMDEAHSPMTVTVEHTGYVTGVMAGVMVTGMQTTHVEMDLRWIGPCVSVDPTALDVTLPLGQNHTLSLNLVNDGAGDTPFSLAEKFGLPSLTGLPEAYVWTVVSPNPTGVSRPAGAAPDDGMFYLIGGESSGGARVGKVQRYDPAAGTWDETLATMPTPTSNQCAAAIGDDIYVPGGYDGAAELSTLQVYHTLTNAWEVVASDPLPAARTAPACAAYNDKLYVFGGFLSAATTTAWVYDPAAAAGSRWTALTDAPFPGAYGAALAVGDQIFYGGVSDNYSADFANVAAYDPATNTWTTYPNLTTARGGAGMWAIENTLLIGGGGWASYLTSVEAYDLSQGSSGSWQPFEASLAQGRRTFGYATAPFQGHLFAVAGWAGSYLAEAEQLDFEPVAAEDVPWLAESPITGTIAADDWTQVDVTFTVLPTMTVGTYEATLMVRSDDPTIEIPVTLTVIEEYTIYLPLVVKP